MGDVGSLALGGGMGVVAVLIKQEVLLVFIGGVFVLEALSVILQVGSYKLRGGSASSRWRRFIIISKRWVAGIENHRALLDRRPGDGAVRADDVEAEVARGHGSTESGSSGGRDEALRAGGDRIAA